MVITLAEWDLFLSAEHVFGMQEVNVKLLEFCK